MQYKKTIRRYLLLSLCICFCASYGVCQNISYDFEEQSDTAFIHVTNNLYFPITLNLKLKSNQHQNIYVPNVVTIPPREQLKKVIHIPGAPPRDTIAGILKSAISISAEAGDPKDLSYDAKYEYRLPYAKDKKFRVMQGFFGKVSHNHPMSYHAVDFALSVGDTIFAAREGIVGHIVEKYSEHGGRELISKANKIIIYHEDGTLGFYTHLDLNGALVEEGEQVKKGQVLGISGWTGFSTAPHLHFVVRRGDGKSVPIRFEGYGKKVLKQGKYYRHKTKR